MMSSIVTHYERARILFSTIHLREDTILLSFMTTSRNQPELTRATKDGGDWWSRLSKISDQFCVPPKDVSLIPVGNLKCHTTHRCKRLRGNSGQPANWLWFGSLFSPSPNFGGSLDGDCFGGGIVLVLWFCHFRPTLPRFGKGERPDRHWGEVNAQKECSSMNSLGSRCRPRSLQCQGSAARDW